MILGFDGVEPTIVDQMFAEGSLPNLSRLRELGGYQRLQTTVPPQSPSAWSSFATCQSPGNHGVYDYIGRDRLTYSPVMGTGNTFPYDILPDGELRKKPYSVIFRKGEPFWVSADRQGARSKLLHIPFAYPPDDLTRGLMLCGAGVPEIGGFNTYFYSLSDSFTQAELAESVGGGVRIRLELTEGKAKVDSPGALDPYKPGQSESIKVPIEVAVDRQNRSISLTLQGKQVTVPEKEWSDWIEWTLPITDQISVRAISLFHVLEAGEHVRIYMSSLQFHPRDPYVRFTTPETYSGEVADRYGLYKTLGWAHDTSALRRNALDEDAFLEEAATHDEWVRKLLEDEMSAGNYELLVAVWTSTDRISHTFWRYRDPLHPLYTADGAARYGHVVEDSYQRMDRIVGEVLDRLSPRDLLFVLSDHGFHSFRKGFSVNTWLVRNGYLVIRDKPDASTAFVDDEDDMLRSVDWSQTRAYALGLGAIYLNIRGREGQGIVEPDAAPQLAEKIREELLAVTDPETGEKVLKSVFGREAFAGKSQVSAPDLQLGYAEGYQTSKTSAKGGIPAAVFEPNLDKWSGEHASSDPEETPGILFSNHPLIDNPAIVDLGVTALQFMNLDVPPEYQGKDLLSTKNGGMEGSTQ
ncbi:MAG: alkaline phosphatase family protein [Candidatus Hydrogenedentes bacterium]|nr:alkaline phosphatase family protein [Candidatus Hydrogenedentota bacterium]